MKRAFLKKIIAVAVVSTTLITMAPAPVSAAWVKGYGNSWRYITGNVSAVGWTQINGAWYYFSADGVMQTGVIQVNGKIYLLADNGQMQTGNAIIGGQVYTFSSNGNAIGDEIPTPSKGFDWVGNSTQTFMPDQVVSGGGSPTDPDSSAIDESESKKEYSLTYKDDDGDRLKTKNVERNDKVKLYKPTKSGYKFVEWNTKKNGDGTSYDYDEEVKITKDLTLYAQWEKSSGSTDSGSTDSGSSESKVSVTDITVSGQSDADKITTLSGTLQMSAKVLPIDASNKNVTWSVENKTGQATISEAGLLTAVANGIVLVKATAKDGSNVAGIQTITISGQTSGGSSGGTTGGDSGTGGGTTGGSTGGINSSTLEDYTVQTMDTTKVNGTPTNPKAYKTLSVLRNTEKEKPFALENITAETLAIQGGDKIVLNNCKIKNLKINDANGTFNLEVGDNCMIDNMELSKGTTINSKSKLGIININTEEVVTIGSSASAVNVNSVAKIKIEENSVIDKMKVGNDSKNAIITGNGTITQFESGSTVELAVKTITNNNSNIQNSSNNYQGLIDDALVIEKATLAVEKAEKSRAEADIAIATSVVNALNVSLPLVKEQLTARLTQITNDNNQLTYLGLAKKDVESAEEKVRLATTTSAQVTLDTAKEVLKTAKLSVEKLKNGSADEINLTERLNVVEKKIDQAEKLKIIINAITKEPSADFTGIDETTFDTAGILGVTSKNLDQIKEKLTNLPDRSKIKTFEEIQKAVSTALTNINSEERIKEAKDLASTELTNAETEVNNLFVSTTTGSAIKVDIGKTAISTAKGKVAYAKEKIDNIKTIGAKDADLIDLNTRYQVVNSRLIEATRQLTSKEVNSLFAIGSNKNLLAPGIGKTQIDAAQISVSELMSLAQSAGPIASNIQLLNDDINNAKVLLAVKDTITKELWDSVSSQINPLLVQKSSLEGNYTFKVMLPISSTLNYLDTTTSPANQAKILLNTNVTNITVPVMIKDDTTSTWSYIPGNWEQTISRGGYSFKFTMTHRVETLNNVFIITMTPQ